MIRSDLFSFELLHLSQSNQPIKLTPTSHSNKCDRSISKCRTGLAINSPLLCTVSASIFKQLNMWQKLEGGNEKRGRAKFPRIRSFEHHNKLASLKELQPFFRCRPEVKSCASTDPYSKCKEGLHMMGKPYLSQTGLGCRLSA